MAFPKNPLDSYSTYTYHFELHASPSWDKLAQLANTIDSRNTTRFKPAGTLVINSRTDAHQVIEDVKIDVLTPSVSRAEVLTGVLGVDMQIVEPGGFAFIEKLDALMRENNVINMDSMVFALKIYFIGRSPDNVISPPIHAGILPLCFVDMEGTFTERGGSYMLKFISHSTLATMASGTVGPQVNYSYIDKAISFEATTIEEALKKYEQRLNEVYKATYERKLDNANGSRPLKYTVTFDPEIRGRLSSVNGNSMDPTDNKKFTFSPRKQISVALMELLQHCPEFQKRVGDSLPNLKKEFHTNSFIPLITTRVYPRDGEVEVNYNVAIYRGGVSNKYEFNYYFANAGQNVDVMSYEVKFIVVRAWLSTRTVEGNDAATNMSGTRPSEAPKTYTTNTLTPNKTIDGMKTAAPEKSQIEALRNDIAYPPTQTGGSAAGYTAIPANDVPAVRLGSDSIASFRGSINPQTTFEIRGHLDILKACVPDIANSNAFVMQDGVDSIWVKVNIFMPDPTVENKKRQFYYKGYYMIVSMTNRFRDGRFMQTLTCQATDDSTSKKAGVTG